jgi:hypothetical protein
MLLRELNAAGRTTVPDEASADGATSFVPTRWRGYLKQTRGQGRGAANRHYWELSVLYGVQARLRSGDMWGPPAGPPVDLTHHRKRIPYATSRAASRRCPLRDDRHCHCDDDVTTRPGAEHRSRNDTRSPNGLLTHQGTTVPSQENS